MKKCLRFAWLVAPLLLSGLWSVKQPLMALSGALSLALPALPAGDSWEDAGGRLSLQRTIQQHFRRYDIYIPLDDIMVKPLDLGHQEALFSLLDRRCGQGSIYVWIPLIFRFPLAGHKVTEWCWIPKIKVLRNTEG